MIDNKIALSDTPISDKADENHNLNNLFNLLSSKCIFTSKDTSKVGIKQENSELSNLILFGKLTKPDDSLVNICVNDFEQLEQVSNKEFYSVARGKAKKAVKHQNYVFLLRAKIAYEMGSDRRLPGGRSKRDDSNIGRMAAYEEVGNLFGVSRSTIEDDVKINKTFGVNPLAETNRSERTVLIRYLLEHPRGYFRTAAYSDDPILAINHAAYMRSVGSYSIKQFHIDLAVKKLRSQSSPSSSKTQGTSKRNEFLECFLTKHEFHFLQKFARIHKCKLDYAVSILINNQIKMEAQNDEK
jgi:hypothetical protein